MGFWREEEVDSTRFKATIWANQPENGARYNVTFTRLYKDEEGWKDSASFGRDDLPLLAKIADQAHTWIFAHAAYGANANGHGKEDGGEF